MPDVPGEMLLPEETWEDGDAFRETAAKLVEMFRENFESFQDDAPSEVREAGPGD